MEYVLPDIEKRNPKPFRTWDGHLVVSVPCGGWRPATGAELALLSTRRLVLIRDMEG